MGVLGGLMCNNGMFDDIVDLIIILVVLEFLCCVVFNDRRDDCRRDC
jgi:hypothetical protein